MLTKKLSSLNTIYELELQESNNHLKALNQFYGKLAETSSIMNNSAEDAKKVQVEIGSLASTAVAGSISVTIPSNTVPGADYKIRVVSNDPFITGSSSSSFSVNATNTWTGAVSSAWENPANWGCGTVPNANTDVVINSGTVVINSNAECRSLNISSAVTLTINTGFALTVFQ